MHVRGNFMLQTKWVLQALLGGADIEKIRRHWPGYRIEMDAYRFSFELVDKPKDGQDIPLAAGQDGLLGALAGGDDRVVNPPAIPTATAPVLPPATPTAPAGGKGDELAQARAAAAAAAGTNPQSLAPVE
jgi:hypothetical protein